MQQDKQITAQAEGRGPAASPGAAAREGGAQRGEGTGVVIAHSYSVSVKCLLSYPPDMDSNTIAQII